MKIIVLHFSRQDEVRKIKINLPNDILAKDLFLAISEKIKNVDIQSFEFYNIDTGKFEVKDDNDSLVIDKFCSVLVLEKEDESESNQLMIEGRAFDITSTGLQIKDTVLKVGEQDNRSEGTGLNTWDGSVVLAKYLEIHSQLVEAKYVLEVGAGTGVAGLSTHILGSKLTILTDLEYTIANLQSNVDRYEADKVQDSNTIGHQRTILVKPLDWGDADTYIYPHQVSCDTRDVPQLEGSVDRCAEGIDSEDPDSQQWDVILGADVVWLDELAPLLSRCLHALAGPQTEVILSHQTRSRRTDDIFFSSLSANFDIEEVAQDDLHPQYISPKIRILRCRLKPK